VKRLVGLAVALIAPMMLCGDASTRQQTPHHEFTVVASRYRFDPDRLEVHQGDTVKITVQTADIPHSFVIDALRVAKKAVPDRPVTFELFVDQPGSFRFYCNLTLEDRCREMHGELVVRPATDPRRSERLDDSHARREGPR
jgi:heme/copper-type cytochrome/quinol oxidase subunit 2